MKNLNLGITPAALGRPAGLRADGIRVQDLIQIGRAIAEGDDRSTLLINALEDLGKVSQNPRDGELDRALDDVAELASLDAAVMDLTAADVRQLAAESATAVQALSPVLRSVPEQRGGEAA